MEERGCENAILRRSSILARHLHPHRHGCGGIHGIQQLHCLEYSPPGDASKKPTFDISTMTELMHGHNVEDRDWIFNLMASSDLFITKKKAGKVYAIPDYDKPMEHQREMTMKRICYLLEKGIFKGWLTNTSSEHERRRHAAILECLGIYDHSLSIILNVQFYVWGSAIRFLGTKRHQKWLQGTEDYVVRGCFAMTELGHGSNVRGIETITTYDPSTKEFIITTPCESAQKYWIGGAANHGTHAVVFSQLLINGRNEGVHAFIAQIRDKEGNACPGIRIADCGHKIGANGVDNGRIWFDSLRIPWENMLNSVANVSPDGNYQSAISDSDQRFGAFMAPLTSGRVNIAVGALYQSKIGLAIAIRYALTRRGAFNLHPDEPEVLLLDYPSHQWCLLPLLAKTYAMSCAGNDLKRMYWKRTPSDSKIIHVLSSGYKAMFTWQNLDTLQKCREACGGQGLKTENRVGHLLRECNVQVTFEGDNNVLMQQVSKALLGEYYAASKKQRPFKGFGLEHMNNARPVIPAVLDASILRSILFQVDIFHLRERDLLERFATQISQFVSTGKSTQIAFTMSYKLAKDLGRAFSQRAVLDCLISTEAKLSSSNSMKDVLGLLRTLYVLVSLEEDISFLRYGYLTPKHSQVVVKEIGELCKELRPYALALVDSFGIPQPYLSPIAFDWVEANSFE